MAALYSASQDGREDIVKALLASTANSASLLDLAQTPEGWTPLFIACVEGHLPVVKTLLEAGARQGLCDLAGWTEKEHAVFRGHMKVAELLVAYEAGECKVLPSSQGQRRGIVRPGVPLKCTMEDQKKIASPLKPSEILPNHHQTQNGQSQIFVTLGPSNTRSKLKSVDLDRRFSGSVHSTNNESGYSVMIQAVGASSTRPYKVELPLLGNMINKPLLFATDNPDNVNLIFSILHAKSSDNDDFVTIRMGIALLKSLRHRLAPKWESLIRDHTIPILENGSMKYVGTVTFSFLIVAPFRHQIALSRSSPGFWKQDGSTQIVGHRGSGANSTARSNLQIGENTIQSFLSATKLGASCVEFDVQVTKDYIPVIFHDFLVMEMGGDVPLNILTSDQFLHLSRS